MTPTTLVDSGAAPQVQICDEPLYEVVDGKRVELPPMGIYQTDIASELVAHIRVFGKAYDLGRAEAEMLFALPGINRERRPDVAFVSYKRWPKSRPFPRAGGWPIAPEIAIEIISPTNLAEEVIKKMEEYFRSGVEQVWVVWPSSKQVYVYDSPTRVGVLTAADDLLGGTILPGFKLPVASLFEASVEEPANGNATQE